MSISISSFICSIVEKKKELCVFGVGEMSQTICKYVLDFFDLKPDYYCDNNENIWGRRIYGSVCISPTELYSIKDNVYVVIAIGIGKREQVSIQLEAGGIKNWIYLMDMLELFYGDRFLADWIGIDSFTKYQCYTPNGREKDVIDSNDFKSDSEKIAIYTCVVGDYDSFHIPESFPDHVDYYYLTDDITKIKDDRVCALNIMDYLPSGIDRNDYSLINRYFKFNGNSIFNKYRYSIYVDGSLKIKNDISDYIKYISKYGFTAFQNPYSRDTYSEGFQISTLGDYNNIIGNVKMQLKRYAKAGLPRIPYLIFGGVLARDHGSMYANEFFEEWYNEFAKGVRRDQLSVGYVMWKKGLDFNLYSRIPIKRYISDFEKIRHLDDTERFGIIS